MENTPNVSQDTMNASNASKEIVNAGAVGQQEFRLTLNCSIRRRPSLVGLPGSDPNDRVYKVGASIDKLTRKNLKGIDGELEARFMPAIIGTNNSDHNFQDKLNEYWGNIGVFIPADEAFMKEDVKGKVLRIEFVVKSAQAKAKIEAETDIEKKVELIKSGILKNLVVIEDVFIPDFVFLCYCLRYSRVAKDITYLDKSPKIHFYIYNKSTAVKTKLNTIDLRNNAIKTFSEIKDNENKVNQLLVMFNKLPNEYDTLDDKLIVLDEEYNKSADSMNKFVTYAKDSNLEIKYLITYAVKKGKLSNPANTDSYYYNQVLLGRSLEDAVRFLNDSENTDARLIKDTLTREIKD